VERQEYVYFMKAAGGLYKIGESIRPVERREQLIQTESLSDLRLLAYLAVDKGVKWEGRLQEPYRHLRVGSKRDWFRLNPVDAYQVYRRMRQLGAKKNWAFTSLGVFAYSLQNA
jgi:hypothetical protein